MSERKISFDTATLDSKILIDDDNYLVMPAIIASEIVHQYDDGWAYKPADELEKMAQVASDIGSVPIKILEHPGPDTNYLLLRQSDVHGRAENFQFVKNLVDVKTKRPMRRGVRADIRWFKNRVPLDIIEKIKTNTLHDVSIGFTHDQDRTVGEWEGVKYDYIQRNIYLNHIAAPIESGRCPGPVCGIGFDTASVCDRIEKRGEEWCLLHHTGPDVGKVIKCFNSEAEALAMHRAIMANKDYLAELDCPVCQAVREVGLVTAAKRLSIAYGIDVLSVIKSEPQPKLESNLDKDFIQAFQQLKTGMER